MLKSIKCFALILSIVFYSSICSFAQSIVQEYGDISISPDNFVTGVGRRCAMDVQKSTGKTVYIYTEKDADPATTKDIWCVIYNMDMTISVNPFRVNNNTTNDQLAPFVVVHQNDNSFYVTWYSNHSGNNDVYVKKISFETTNSTSAAVTSSSDILVNDITTGEQLVPLATINYKYNEIIFAFRDQSNNDGGGTGSQAVYAKRMTTSSLTSISAQFLVHTVTAANQVLNAIEMKNDYLVISYTSNHISANSHDVYVSILAAYDPPGPASVIYNMISEFKVNNYLTGDQNNSHLAINETAGQFVVTWSSQQDGSGFGAYAKIYTLPGATIIKDEFLVNSVTANNELLSRAVWEESTQQLLFFFHYSTSNLGTLKYRFFDGASVPGQYSPVDVDKDLIGGLDTKSYYNQFYNVVYNSYTNRLYLVYDIYDSYTTYNSKSKARSYIFTHPNLITPSFINSTDLDKNWVHSRSYGEDGSLLLESRAYSNNWGNSLQSQTRNLEAELIFAAGLVYDQYNRPVLKTLPAPIEEKLFTFHNDLITPTGSNSAYSYQDFDLPITSGNLSGEINNPKAVNSNSIVGKYYSDNNILESYVPNSSFPYQRVNYNSAILGGMMSSTTSGEDYKMGQGHDVRMIRLPVLTNELLHYTTLRKNYFSNSFPLSELVNATKTITRDQDGKEIVSYMDNQGKVIANGNSGGTEFVNVTTSLNTDFYYYDLASDLHTSFSQIMIESPVDIEIYDFNTSVSWTGPAASNFYQTLTNPQHIQVRSTKPFRISYVKKYVSTSPYIETYTEETVEPERLGSKGSSVDLHVQDLSGVSITAPAWVSMKLYDLSNGTLIYSGSVPSSFSFGSGGLYRIKIEGIPVAANNYTASNITITNKQYYKELSYYFYDDAGRVIAMVAPKGVKRSETTLPKFVTSYKYSSSGRMLRETDPDKGTKDFVYRKDGQIRFTRDSRQQAESVQTFAFINYDLYGRPVETGEFRAGTCSKVFESHLDGTNLSNGTNALLNSVAVDGGLGTCRYENTSYFYDLPDGTAPNARTQNYTNGSQVTKTSNANSTTWVSYDYQGRIEWTQQKINGLTTSGTDVKTVDYQYDLKNNLTNIIYQTGIAAERFEHKYTYNKNQQLSKAESKRGNALYQEEAEYSYYKHGPLKRLELANDLQGIDYIYTLQGNLKSINHPSLDEQKDPGRDGYASGSHAGFGKDVFGINFQYHAGDYTKTGTNIQNTTLSGTQECYNGNIQAIRWKTRGQGMGTGNTEELLYAYTYDDKDQLTQASFGTVAPANEQTFIAHADNKYKIYSLNYDPNGNITSMIANSGAGSVRDNFVYENGGLEGSAGYTDPVDNKLAGVKYNGTSNYHGKYEYDNAGRLTKQTYGSSNEKRIKYNSLGLVSEVRNESDILKVSFAYDDRGYRLKKVTYTSTGAVSFTTWYVRDVAGTILSVYDDKAIQNTYAQTEIPLYGNTKIGAVYINSTQVDYVYEIADHLGNVRATINRVKSAGEAVIMTWKDYYPYGDVMDDRHSVISTVVPDKYGYQGAYSEKDDETGWNSFDLRMYDARIGKFLSGDPYSQYWSSFMAMGNNPISTIDPSGGTGTGYEGPSPGSAGGVPMEIYAYFSAMYGGFMASFASAGAAYTQTYGELGGNWTGNNSIYGGGAAVPTSSVGAAAAPQGSSNYSRGSGYYASYASNGISYNPGAANYNYGNGGYNNPGTIGNAGGANQSGNIIFEFVYPDADPESELIERSRTGGKAVEQSIRNFFKDDGELMYGDLLNKLRNSSANIFTGIDESGNERNVVIRTFRITLRNGPNTNPDLLPNIDKDGNIDDAYTNVIESNKPLEIRKIFGIGYKAIYPFETLNSSGELLNEFTTRVYILHPTLGQSIRIVLSFGEIINKK